MELLKSIENVAFFNTLDSEQKNYLSTISTLEKFNKNSIINFEDDINNSLQFLIDGLVKVYKIDKFNNEIFLYNVTQGEIISEINSIENNNSCCFSNTICLKESTFLTVDFEKFKKYFIESGILATTFISAILKRQNKLQHIINREFVFNSTAKVAHILYTDIQLFNNWKKKSISTLLHIQPETLSRVLKKFTQENIICEENKQYFISDKEKLKSFFKTNI